MRKKSDFKRVLLIALAILVFVSGCGKKSDNSQPDENGLSFTQLKMILVSDKPVIFDEIYSEVNKVVKEKINAEVSIDYISFSDMEKKYPLIFAANEKFDLVFSASWLYYNQLARKNAFLDLSEEMIKQYAPISYETIPAVAWEQAKIDGKIYMVPNSGIEYGQRVVGIRGDLREKYDIPPLETMDDLEVYLKAIAMNEKEMTPWPDVTHNLYFFLTKNWEAPSNLSRFINYSSTDEEIKIFNSAETPEYYEHVKKMKEYCDLGFWPKDIISSKFKDGLFDNGQSGALCGNLETVSGTLERLSAEKPEWKLELYDMSGDKKKLMNNFIDAGMSIHETSKNVERSLMLIDILRNDKKIFDLTWYGIENKHWTAVGDMEYTPLNETLQQNQQYMPGCVWGWKNGDLMRSSTTEFPAKKEILDKWVNVDRVISSGSSFVFDDAEVKNELANIVNVTQQYGDPLEMGMLADVDEGLATLKEKLKSAGIDKVITEMQRQVDEYLKSLSD